MLCDSVALCVVGAVCCVCILCDCDCVYVWIYYYTRSEEEFTELCKAELALCDNCLRVNPKAYSVWLARQWILLHSPQTDWAREKALCDKFLLYDERNCTNHAHTHTHTHTHTPSTQEDGLINLIVNSFSCLLNFFTRSTCQGGKKRNGSVKISLKG